MSQITRGHGQDNNYNVAYHFSFQRMDYFHGLSMASNQKIGTLSLQLALGHRSLQARTFFGQFALQYARYFQFTSFRFGPYGRYAFSYLAKPYDFLYHRIEIGIATAYQFGESPFSMQFNAGASLNVETQKASTHSFPDYTLAIGLAYAIH